MIIDVHTHIFEDRNLETYLKKANGHVSKILTIHSPDLDTGGEKKMRSIGEVVSFAKTKNNLFVIGSISVNSDISKQLVELEGFFKNKEIFGIKIYPGYEPFFPSDARIDQIVKLCEKYNKPLVIHTGDVFDPEGAADLIYSHPTYVDGLAVRNPNCKIVIAHFGFPNFLQCANVLSKNINVYADLSGTIVNAGSEDNIKNLTNAYIQDLKHAFAYFPDIRNKVMFGTDYSGEHIVLNQFQPYVEMVENVFTGDEAGDVYSGLAEKLFFS